MLKRLIFDKCEKIAKGQFAATDAVAIFRLAQLKAPELFK